jgi:hypothetical protein
VSCSKENGALESLRRRTAGTLHGPTSRSSGLPSGSHLLQSVMVGLLADAKSRYRQAPPSTNSFAVAIDAKERAHAIIF